VSGERFCFAPMECTAATFPALLADFKHRLTTAEFVAVDTELTGTNLQPDSLCNPVEVRYERLRSSACDFSVCQVGFTLARRTENDGVMALSSYNIFVFPYHVDRKFSPHFKCTTSNMRFLAREGFDFNRWASSGVLFRRRTSAEQTDSDPPSFVALWQALCEAQKPLVFHGAFTDLAFLLSAFEAPLPPSGEGFASLVRSVTPRVHDTAHLFAAVGAVRGKFRRQGLRYFLDEVSQRVSSLRFELDEGSCRYASGDKAHEAGYDSLMTAKLFALLQRLDPETVRLEANRLYLWMSTDCIDISPGVANGFVGRKAYFPNTSAFTVTVSSGTAEAIQGNCRVIWTQGGQVEVLDDSRLLVLLPDVVSRDTLPNALQDGSWHACPAPPWDPSPCMPPAQDDAEVAPGSAAREPVKKDILKKPAGRPGAKPAAKAVLKKPAK